MLLVEDFYTRLGLSRDVSADEIRAAYFEAARKLHPDTNPDPGALEQFLWIQEAYDSLIDPAKRAAYNDTLIPLETNAPALSYSATLSRKFLPYIDEPQLIYAMLDLTSIPDPGTATTPPLNLCLVIDRSTSMQGIRIDTVKANVVQLLKQLRPQDIISIVVYSDRADVLIPATRVSELTKAQMHISMIQTSGGTEILHGMEAGLDQLMRNKSPIYISHMILLTDGRTYGDEGQCIQLAEKAAEDGIGISGLGIGNEWNDKFLDELTGCSGGSSTYITGASDLKNFLDQKVNALGRVYAENVTLDFDTGPHVRLTYAFRVQPDASPLGITRPIRGGNIAQFHSLRILLEFEIDPIPTEETEVVLCRGYIKMEIPTRAIPSARLKVNLHIPIEAGADVEQPPQVLLQCLSRLSLYRMQERARQEVENGDVVMATKHLQYLATHLLSQGEKDLAQAVLLEADSLNKNNAFTQDGDKRIKYGTRALILPPITERMMK